MKIALAQLNYHIGNFESNTNKIIAISAKQKKTGPTWLFLPNCVFADTRRVIFWNLTSLLAFAMMLQKNSCRVY
jgi:hypothetical protein